MARPFHIDIHRSGGLTVLAAAGELDVASAEKLLLEARAVADEAAQAAVAIDLRAVSFIDSTGLRALLSAEEACRDAGLSFSVVRGPRQVQRLMAITRATERLNVREELPDA